MRHLLFILLALVVFVRAITLPREINGDGLEYIVQTQAIALRYELRIEPEVAAEYWNWTNPFGIKLGKTRAHGPFIDENSQAGGGFGGLYPDLWGTWHYVHFWAYSLVCSPIYLLFHKLDSSGRLEYLTFGVVNWLLFSLPFLILLLKSSGYKAHALMVLFVLTPLTGYMSWSSPEIMCFSLVLSSFLLIDGGRFEIVAPLLLGVAATQYPNILALLGFQWFLKFCKSDLRSMLTMRWFAATAMGIAVTGLSFLWYYQSFGYFNLLSKIGSVSPVPQVYVGPQYMSLSRAVEFFINPFSGTVWFFPVIFILILCQLSRRSAVLGITALLFALFEAWLCSAINNFNSATFGCARYAVWFMTPLFFCVLTTEWPQSFRPFRQAIFAALLLASGYYLGIHKVVVGEKDFYRNPIRGEVSRLIRLTGHAGSAETFAENVSGEEFPRSFRFNGIYIWNVGREQSLWLISRRAAMRLKTLEASTVGSCPVELREPFGCEENKITLDKKRLGDWQRDTYLGDYQYLWLNASVKNATANVLVYLR